MNNLLDLKPKTKLEAALQIELADLKAKHRKAINALKDADFVIHGSRAIKQSDEDLQKREEALMRFFETLADQRDYL